jgi:hypothetical protein
MTGGVSMGVKTVSWTDLIEHSDYTGKPMGRPAGFRMLDAKDWQVEDDEPANFNCDCLIHSKRGPKKRAKD